MSRDLQVGDFVFVLPHQTEEPIEFFEGVEKYVVTKIEIPRIYITSSYNSHVLIYRNNEWVIEGPENDRIPHFVSRDLPTYLRLIDVVRHFLDKYWFWPTLSSNPNISFQDILDHPDLPWDISRVSDNPAVTIEDARRHPDLGWDWNRLDRRQENREKDIDSSVYTSIQSNYPTRDTLPRNIEDLLPSNPQEWDWVSLSQDPTITPEFVEKHIDKDWDWYFLSYNPNITPEFIEKHIDKDLSWGLLSSNPNITQEFVEKHIDRNWDWEKLSEHPNITLSFALSHFDKDWNLFQLMNDLSTDEIQGAIDVFDRYFKGDDDSDNISYNSNLTLDLVAKNPNFPWNWTFLSENKFGWSEQPLIKPSR